MLITGVTAVIGVTLTLGTLADSDSSVLATRNIRRAVALYAIDIEMRVPSGGQPNPLASTRLGKNCESG